MNLSAHTSSGAIVETKRRPTLRLTPERVAAERHFKARPSIAKATEVPLVAIANTSPALPSETETEHQKVFRLVDDRKFEEAARIAARLINANDAAGFFVYGGSIAFRHAETWYAGMVDAARNAEQVLIETITPELAQIFLASNDGNRRVKAPNLARIMRDIADDRWDLNGESLIVSEDGKVNDGQHRNFAVLLTGKSIKTVLSIGLSRASMRTVDIGEKRQAKDRLGIAGVGDYIKKAAMAAMAFQIYNGRSATAAEADDYFFDNKERIELASSLIGSNVRGVGPAACGVAAMHLLSIGASEEDIRTFFSGVRTGTNLSARSPIKKLHDGIYKAGAQIKLSRENWMSAFVHHFVVWKQGRSLASVVFNQPLAKGL